MNPSLVLRGVNDVFIDRDRAIPELKRPDDVLVRVLWTGICGSEVHYYTNGRIGDFKLTSPTVLGHECSGTVAKMGPEVHDLREGDLVAMEPAFVCRRCMRCREGRYNLCSRLRIAATPPCDGALAKYYVLPADAIWRLPQGRLDGGVRGEGEGQRGMTAEEGALIEPLSVAVHVVKRGGVKYGDSVVVFGAGTVGLLCCAVAKVLGASKVIAVDTQTHKLEFARSFAATATYQSQRAPARENANDLIDENHLGDGADVCLEISGAEACIQMGIHVLRKGGTFVQCGMGTDEVVFPITVACIKELKVVGSILYGPGDFPMAIDLVATGKVDVKKLITNKVPFEEVEQAILQVKEGKVFKMLIAAPTD